MKIDNDNFTLLHFAVTIEDFEKTKSLLQCDVKDVNVKDDDGWTPLHHAVCGGNLEISNYLLNNGADVNAQTMNGKTPLHIAIYRSDYKIIKCLLLEHNASLNI